jgi:hypothetical protein
MVADGLRIVVDQETIIKRLRSAEPVLLQDILETIPAVLNI